MPHTHSDLTATILDWIKSNHDISNAFLMVDDPIYSYDKPRKIGSSIPDVYVKRMEDDFELIGEAKPGYDLTSPRTEKQLADYFAYMVRHTSAIFVLSTEPAYLELAKKIAHPLLSRSDLDSTRVFFICP